MRFCVIGLGRLGFSVASRLAENGMEVVAIDMNENIVADIRDEVTQAICMQVIDEDSLHSIGIEEIDTAIVATGKNFAQSILITALLKKLHVPKVIARAINEIHKDILMVLGAEEIILPEKEVGIRLADNLSYPYMDLFRLTNNFAISKVPASEKFIGKTPAQIEFFKNFKVNYLGRQKDEHTVSRDVDRTIEQGDQLIFAGENKYLEKIAKM